MIDHLHDIKNDDVSISRIERQYRKLLSLTIQVIRLSSIQATDEDKLTEANLEKLLSFRPTIEDMKLILEPMCYLSNPNTTLITYSESLQRDKYRIILQQQLVGRDVDGVLVDVPPELGVAADRPERDLELVDLAAQPLRQLDFVSPP